jgi:hypothetical protein
MKRPRFTLYFPGAISMVPVKLRSHDNRISSEGTECMCLLSISANDRRFVKEVRQGGTSYVAF